MRRTAAWLALWSAALIGCGDDGGPGDPLPCSADTDCDDGLYCNGPESCDPDAENATAFGCVAGARPCEGSACIETDDGCDAACETPDGDGDGADRVECGGDDCDDEDANRYPGNPEVCDTEGRDEDCDPVTVGAIDRDGDGFVDAQCRNEGGGAGTDCDDTDPRIGPLRTELCNGRDDDCDGETDEGVALDGFVDMDADGRGDSSRALRACGDAARFAPVGEDCDDADLEVQPTQNELCDGKDNDCDGTTDENAGEVYWYVDADGDGYGEIDGDPVLSCDPIEGRSILPTDCDDDEESVSPAAEETCNGVDDDCNGAADFIGPGGDLEDDDRDGVPDISCGGTDCDDQDPFAAPGFPELCNERDDDCDGMVDEGVTESDWYVDLDGDSYGEGPPVTMCAAGSGFAPRDGDCNDDDSGVAPGAAESCDGVDDDCDGTIDEEASARCGGSGQATYACVGGRCRIAGCQAGFGDCDLRSSTGCETELETSTDHCGLCFASCSGSCTDGACSTAPAPWSLSVMALDSDGFSFVPATGGWIRTLAMSPRREWLTDASGAADIALPTRTWVVASGAGLYPTAVEANAEALLRSAFAGLLGGEDESIFPVPLSGLVSLGAQRPSRGMVAVVNIDGGSGTDVDPDVAFEVDIDLPYAAAAGGRWYFGEVELDGDPAFRSTQDLVIFGDVLPGPVTPRVGRCRLRSAAPVVYPGVLTTIVVDCPSRPADSG